MISELDDVRRRLTTVEEETASLNILGGLVLEVSGVRRTQAEHGQMLKEHKQMLSEQGRMLREVLDRLPA